MKRQRVIVGFDLCELPTRCGDEPLPGLTNCGYVGRVPCGTRTDTNSKIQKVRFHWFVEGVTFACYVWTTSGTKKGQLWSFPTEMILDKQVGKLHAGRCLSLLFRDTSCITCTGLGFNPPAHVMCGSANPLCKHGLRLL